MSTADLVQDNVHTRPVSRESECLPTQMDGMSGLVAAEQVPLRRNLSWTLLGNVVYAACQWAIIVVLAKLGTPAMVGQFVLAMAISAPVFMFSSLQLRVVQATDAHQQYRFGHYLGLRLVAVMASVLVVAGMAAVYRGRPGLAGVILLVGAAKALESISDVFYGLLQQRERMDRIAKSLLVKGPASLCFFGAALYLGHSVAWGAVGLVVAWGLVLLSYDMGSAILVLRGSAPLPSSDPFEAGRSALRPVWDAPVLGRLALLACPLGAAAMLASLAQNIPNYIVEHQLGAAALGFFAAMAYVLRAQQLVAAALIQAAVPRLSRYYHIAPVKFRRLILQLVEVVVLVGGLCVAVALVAGRPLLSALYRPEYARHTDVFVLLVASGIIAYAASCVEAGLTAARCLRPQFFSCLVQDVLLLGGCVVMTSRYGLAGAALAVNAAGVARLAISSTVLVRALHRASSGAKEAQGELR
jgi:O-antigen/teichoic acid export membrane protein